MTGSTPVLQTDALSVHYQAGRKTVRAVDQVSISLERGQTLAIVGESGCGKSSLARALVGLETPTHGTVSINGRNAIGSSRADRAALRNAVQMIFQDPYSSFNPRKTIGSSLQDALRLSGKTGTDQRAWRDFLLDAVSLGPDVLSKYPHEFSGGQRQRLAIVRALSTGAKIIVCDEPVSALDVSVQGQILNTMMALQAELQLSFVFISHDLAVVKHVADEVLVMYLGKVMEAGPRESFWPQAAHPYSLLLMNAVPGVQGSQRMKAKGGGSEIATAIDPPAGCVFHTRCPSVIDACRTETPPLAPRTAGRDAACHCV